MVSQAEAVGGRRGPHFRYQFEPPNHFVTVRLPEVLADLTDAELANWSSELSKEETPA